MQISERAAQIIEGLKTTSRRLTPQQGELIALHERVATLSPTEAKLYGSLVRLEIKRADLQNQEIRASQLIGEERRRRKATAQRERNARLYSFGRMMAQAGLIDAESGEPKFPEAELMGGLMTLCLAMTSSDPKQIETRRRWAKSGSQQLSNMFVDSRPSRDDNNISPPPA